MELRAGHIRWAALAVIGLLLLAVAIYGWKAIQRLFGFGSDTEDRVFNPLDYQPTPYVPDGGPIRPQFHPDSVVAELKDVLETALFDASPRCRAYRRLLELTDNEFILVINTFYEKLGKSLRQAMNDTWQSGCTLFGIQWDERVYDRMQQLNVIA